MFPMLLRANMKEIVRPIEEMGIILSAVIATSGGILGRIVLNYTADLHMLMLLKLMILK